VTCGDGVRTRSRDNVPAENGGTECEGDAIETEVCTNSPCSSQLHSIVVHFKTLFQQSIKNVRHPMVTSSWDIRGFSLFPTRIDIFRSIFSTLWRPWEPHRA